VRLRDWRLRPDWLSATILTVFVCCTASLAFALGFSGPAIALGSAARVCLLAISVYLFLYVRDGPGEFSSAEMSRFVRVLFCTAAVSALLACIDFYFQLPAPAGYGPQFVWLDSGVFRRAQGVFYEASTLGNLCAFFITMIAVALLAPAHVRPLPNWAMLLAGVPLAGALVLSYSRASVVNVCVALAVLAWVARERIRWYRVISVLLAVCAVGAGALQWVFPRFFEAWILRVWASLHYFGEAPNAVLSGRLHTWGLLLEYLLENPLQALVGIGYKTLPYSTVTGSTAIADNAYLTFLVETGVAGLAALICLNAAILAAAWRAARSADPHRSFAGVWMLCFWAGQTVQMLSADLLTYWRVLPAYFCILAMATAGERNRHTR
jgi:O-antigen ligase